VAVGILDGTSEGVLEGMSEGVLEGKSERRLVVVTSPLSENVCSLLFVDAERLLLSLFFDMRIATLMSNVTVSTRINVAFFDKTIVFSPNYSKQDELSTDLMVIVYRRNQIMK
jgi:hypothetical protein